MITNFFRNFATLGFQGSRVQSDAICRSCIAASNLLPSFDGVRSPEISPLMDDRLSRSPAASEEKQTCNDTIGHRSTRLGRRFQQRMGYNNKKGTQPRQRNGCLFVTDPENQQKE